MRNGAKAFCSESTYQITPILSVSCFCRQPLVFRAILFFWGPSERSSGTITGRNHFFADNSLSIEDRETNPTTLSVCLVKTCRLLCNITYLGQPVTVTWGQIFKLTSGHLVYGISASGIDFDLVLREKHDAVKILTPSWLDVKLFLKEHFRKNHGFWL